MRVKSFLVSFLFVCFVSQLPAETVTLKNYPATQTDSEGRTENQKFSILYDTDENELSFWFVEDFGVWSARYWFYVGRLPGYVGISERPELQRHFKGAKSRGEKEKRLIKIGR